MLVFGYDSECGGKMSGPNGVIEINNTTLSKGPRSWQVLCEWVVTVRPGRMIEVKVVEMSIAQGPSFTCTDNYLMVSLDLRHLYAIRNKSLKHRVVAHFKKYFATMTLFEPK